MVKAFAVASRVAPAILFVLFGSHLLLADSTVSTGTASTTVNSSSAVLNEGSGFFVNHSSSPSSTGDVGSDSSGTQNPNYFVAQPGYFLASPNDALKASGSPFGSGGGGGGGGSFGSMGYGSGVSGSFATGGGGGNGNSTSGLNAQTGAAGIGGDYGSSATVNVSNPEPASLVLLGTGLIGLAMWRRATRQR